MWVKKSALQAEGPMQGSSDAAEAHVQECRARDYRAGHVITVQGYVQRSFEFLDRLTIGWSVC